ncbi:MAG: hypothetical protein ACI8W3_003375 [Myxococcota bacterium]|jgi:hypothetical protein
MDDVIVLAPTRHKLRRAVKVVNETFDELGLVKHPDKTFIGRVERGFDFLGYHLAPGRPTLSRATVERFALRVHRLYEQEGGSPKASPCLVTTFGAGGCGRSRGYLRPPLGADDTNVGQVGLTREQFFRSHRANGCRLPGVP